MPAIGPIKGKDLIYYFRKLGFTGPFSGAKHQFMMRATLSVRIPNPHEGDISKDLLVRILRQANIEKNEWEKLR